MKNWYVVQCKPNQDARAEENLDNQCFETFRPLARVRRRCNGQLKHAVESLFPRYFFIHLDDSEENWTPIRSTRGVANLVRFRNSPATVPPVIIDALKSRTDDDNCVDLSQPRYVPNQRVRIVEGPFRGYEAIFASRRGEERVVVLFTMMQQHQHLVLPETAIEPA